jgi:hypothetical protein
MTAREVQLVNGELLVESSIPGPTRHNAMAMARITVMRMVMADSLPKPGEKTVSINAT